MGCASSSTASPKAGKGATGDEKKSSTVGQTKIKSNAKEGTVGTGFMVLESTGRISDSYKIEQKKIGEGSYGSVSICQHKFTNQKRAVKSLGKAQMKDAEKFKEEIRIMKLLDHPNIVKLYETYEDKKMVYLVMELCTGGELFDRIIEVGHFTEVQAAIVMQQMLRAVYYMHENSFCHRDLKPENFLFSTKEPIEQATLKIIDFGLAFEFQPGKDMKTKAGTPFYVAPQVLQGKYDQSADLWSIGVILFVLLCGYPPFWGESDKEVLSKVKAGAFTFNPADWKNVSHDAQNLIRNLLKMSQKERYTAEQALQDEWVKMKAPRATKVALSDGLVNNLKGFRSQNKLKKAALHVIAANMNESQIKDLREQFVAMDVNGDGLLTVKELRDGMSKAGLTEIPPDLAQIIKEVDSNGSGTIDYTEFLAATLDRQKYQQEDVCWAAFRVFDRDGNGKISKDELTKVLADGAVAAVAQRDIAELLKDVDANGDGEIDFQEFMEMMKGDGPGGNKSTRSGNDVAESNKES
eukprot:TRINITY_DN12996_c0_g1_i1.p1 TRINITY_DN12996_c0_g1~~TRINITY_DN12996_c0_g1_i1.p1  ORF type:complete len:522 (+),score=141.17 TRINITY_DN12996_c0_g1_i1:38-1603(+)